jgi:hypothetical protein
MSLVRLAECLTPKITILQVIICDELRKGSMLNSGNNDREQNWLLLSPREKKNTLCGSDTIVIVILAPRGPFD